MTAEPVSGHDLVEQLAGFTLKFDRGMTIAGKLSLQSSDLRFNRRFVLDQPVLRLKSDIVRSRVRRGPASVALRWHSADHVDGDLAGRRRSAPRGATAGLRRRPAAAA